MSELLILYKWTILAGVLAAPVLALLGVQLATRERSMQTLCVGQGAMVGVLCGIGFLHKYEWSTLGAIGPFLTAVLSSALTFIITDLLVAKRTASKNTTFAFVFALLSASSYLVSSLFPALESHMAQVYFGDLATLTIMDSQFTIVASLLSLLFVTVFYKLISNQSFELSIFGDAVTAENRGTRGLRAFKLLTLIVLCFSVQFVGFLFTMSMLFLPTGLLNFMRTKGLRLHLFLCSFLAVLSTLVGFLISLNYTRLPTVPAIVMVLFITTLVVIVCERVFLACRQFVLADESQLRNNVSASTYAREN